MELQVSPQALQQIKKFKAQNESWQSQALRIYIAGKGCDGFTYGVAFDDKSEGDLQEVIADEEIICDENTYKFIKGSHLDWVDDERGQGFVVENPRHKKFRGKFYKRKGWEERLL